jgi:uncharacterized membrane protein YuzA (DUF378 family)
MERLSGFAKVLLAVAIVGALNWGLIGFFNFNLVDAIFGGGSREETSGLSRVIYALVGLCGLASLVPLFRTGTHPVAQRPAAAT